MQTKTAEGHRSLIRRDLVAAAAALVVGSTLGYLGWTLPVLGASLGFPTLIVLGVGLAIAGVTWVLASFRYRRRYLWVFSVIVAVLTVAAAVWTLEFALPTKMASDARANRRVMALFAQLGSAADHQGIAPPRCLNVTTGSIGPLDAPYRECGTWTNVGHLVSFSSATANAGLVYTDRPSVSFEDQCYRHLVGAWWATASETNGMGGCPFGYRFSGGG